MIWHYNKFIWSQNTSRFENNRIFAIWTIELCIYFFRPRRIRLWRRIFQPFFVLKLFFWTEKKDKKTPRKAKTSPDEGEVFYSRVSELQKKPSDGFGGLSEVRKLQNTRSWTQAPKYL